MTSPRKRLHIADIAKLSGVSSATVSRVMNGSRPVSPELRERVLVVAKRFDYQPSQLARNLRLGRTATVGVLVSDVENPHFSSLIKYLEESLFRRGTRVLFCNTEEDPRKQSAYLDVMAAERVMGVVISPAAFGDQEVTGLMDLGIPVVAIDRPLSDPRADLVVSDNAEAVTAGTNLLIDAGCRHIGLIGGREGVWTTSERLEGYLSALSPLGLTPHAKLREFTVEMGYRAAAELLDEVPDLDGLVAANNQMTIGALRLLRDRKVVVPDQLKIVAFDDPPWADLVEVPMTTIAQPIQAMAEAAVSQLFKRIAEPTLPPERIVLACRLKVRESSGPASARSAVQPDIEAGLALERAPTPSPK
jgi:DNA-binding LacI/PurR family transcriptional regulator